MRAAARPSETSDGKLNHGNFLIEIEKVHVELNWKAPAKK